MTSDERNQATGLGGGVWDALKRGGDSLAQAARRLAQVQRLQSQMQRLRARRRDTLQAIGEQVYALHGRGRVRNRDVLQNCEALDQIACQLADLHRQVEELREQARRPSSTQEPLDDSFLTDDDFDEEMEIAEPADAEPVDVETHDEQEFAADEETHPSQDQPENDERQGHEDDEREHGWDDEDDEGD
jgi:cell division protein FtsB